MTEYHRLWYKEKPTDPKRVLCLSPRTGRAHRSKSTASYLLALHDQLIGTIPEESSCLDLSKHHQAKDLTKAVEALAADYHVRDNGMQTGAYDYNDYQHLVTFLITSSSKTKNTPRCCCCSYKNSVPTFSCAAMFLESGLNSTQQSLILCGKIVYVISKDFAMFVLEDGCRKIHGKRFRTHSLAGYVNVNYNFLRCTVACDFVFKDESWVNFHFLSSS